MNVILYNKAISLQDTNELLNELKDESYFDIFEQRVRNYETGAYDFLQLNELQLIYYFVHHDHALYTTKKQSTKNVYLRELLMFYRDVKQQFSSLQELAPFHLTDYQQHLKERYKPNTVNKKSTIIKGFLRWLHEIGYLTQDVAKGMKSSQTRLEHQPNKDLSLAEVKQLLHYYRDRYIGDYLLVLVLVTTGLRIFEWAKAKVGEIVIEEGTGLHFLSVMGKRDKIRYVLLHDEVVEAIEAYRERKGLGRDLTRGLDTALFPKNEKGAHYHPTYLSERVTGLIRAVLPEKSAQYDISAHSFRHAYAQLLDSNGASLQEIQRALGHEDPNTTMIYLARREEMKNHVGKKYDISIL